MADRTVVAKLRAETDQYKRDMADAAKATESVATAAKKAEKERAAAAAAAARAERERAAALQQLGAGAGKIGLAAAAGLAAIVVATSGFDQAMSHVRAATHETAGNMRDLREAAIQAGADTAYSASEAAGAIEELAKAGVSTKDILGGGLSGALDLAAAGSIAVGDAAEIAATALTQFKLSGEQVPHVADLLAAGAGKAQGEVGDLAMALKQSGLVASQMGISVEQTTGTLAAFASAGLLGSDAGTSFRTMLLRLANPTDESAGLMEQLGIAAYDTSGKFVGMSAIAGQLQKAFEGKTQAERDSALATIFGSDAIRAASVLYSQGAQGIDQWTDNVNDAGYAAETAAIKMDNLRGDVEKLMGSLETAMIGSGEGSQGFLRGLVQGADEAVDSFNHLPSALQNTATGMLAITAITGGGLWFGSRVIRSVADTREALANLGTTGERTGRLLRTGLNIAAVVASLNLLDDALDEVFGNDLETSKLGRSLEALASGNVAGELRRKYGSELQGLAQDAKEVTWAFDDFGDVYNWFPRILNKIPKVGGFLGAYVSDAKDNFKVLDEQLASLAESGRADQAAANYERVFKAITDGGVSAKNAASFFPEYQLAVDNAGRVSLSLGDAIGGVMNGLRGQGDAALDASGKLLSFSEVQDRTREEIEALREAALKTGGEFVGLGEKVDDAKVSLNGWIQDLNDQAAALEAFTENAKNAADRGLNDGLIAALRAAGPEGALRMRELAGATDAEITNANKAWKRGQRAVNDYVDSVATIPNPTIDVNTGPAITKLQALRSLITGLTYELTQPPLAQGLTFNKPTKTPKKGKATGGRISGPGGPTDDLIPTWLSNGEYVVRASAVAKYGPGFFDMLNAERLASGGQPGKKSKTTSQSSLLVPSLDASIFASLDVKLPRTLAQWNAAMDASKAAVERETKSRDDLISKSDQLSSSISDKLRQGFFDSASTDAWLSTEERQGSAVSSLFASLSSSIANGQAWTDAQNTLAGKGVSGGALEALLAQARGPQDLAAIAAMSQDDIGRYLSMYAQSTQVTSAASAGGANLVWGEQLQAANASLAAVNQTNALLSQQNAALIKAIKDSGDKNTKELVKAFTGAVPKGKR